MILIGYAIWIVLSIFIGMFVAKKFSRGRYAPHVVRWGLSAVLILLPYWDVILGVPVMLGKCTNQAGLHVNESISFPISSLAVNGDKESLICLGCNEFLVKGIASEVQAVIYAGHNGQISDVAITEKPGPTRYWLAPKGDPACNSFYRVYDTEADKRSLWENYGLPYNDSLCIGSESINFISTDYQVVSSIDLLREARFVEVVRKQIRFFRTGAESDLAVFRYFRQHPWTEKVFYFPLPPVPRCPDMSNEEPGVSDTSLPLRFLFRKIQKHQKTSGGEK